MYLEKVSNFLTELFFPSFCFGCQKEGTFLCQDCTSTLEISEYNYCLCGKNPLRLPADSKNGKCSRCQNKELSGLYSALPYKERPLTRKLIHQFKYPPYIKSLSKTLAIIIAKHLLLAQNNAEEIWGNSVLVPVPLEINKQKNRGYNQTEELAKELSKILKVTVASNILAKIKSTLPQMKLSKAERENNLKNSFKIKKSSEISGKRIFLVDDVYTTGSTMEECAKILKQNNAKTVWGIAIAREE